MDYTLSNSYDTDAGTGLRMHEDAKAIPTVWSGKDANSILWSLMEIVKAAGLAGLQFDKATPASYRLLLRALSMLSVGSQIVYTANGTLVVPANVWRMHIRVWGAAGGGGGARTSANSFASGGGGGGYAEGIYDVTPGASLAVAVGVPGTPGVGGSGTPTDGGNGGTTSVGALISATGGTGGRAADGAIQVTTGSGGLGSGGQLNLAGISGITAYTLGASQYQLGSGGAAFSMPATPGIVSGASLNVGSSAVLRATGGGGGSLGGGGGSAGGGLAIVRFLG